MANINWQLKFFNYRQSVPKAIVNYQLKIFNYRQSVPNAIINYQLKNYQLHRPNGLHNSPDRPFLQTAHISAVV